MMGMAAILAAAALAVWHRGVRGRPEVHRNALFRFGEAGRHVFVGRVGAGAKEDSARAGCAPGGWGNQAGVE